MDKKDRRSDQDGKLQPREAKPARERRSHSGRGSATALEALRQLERRNAWLHKPDEPDVAG